MRRQHLVNLMPLVFCVVMILARSPTSVALQAGETVSHRVRVMHRAVKDSAAVDCLLHQSLDAAGQPVTYALTVESVFCVDGQCQVVDVKMYWDDLGRYLRFEVAPGHDLEKAEGKPFSAADYDQLHRVLANRRTQMWDLQVEEVAGYQKTVLQGSAMAPVQGDSAVDGLSAATRLLDRSQYVVGAAWTCYTLWHWVNGDMVSIIRNKTAEASDNQKLRSWLRNGNVAYQRFALRQLSNRRVDDLETLLVMKSLSSVEDRELQKLLIAYAEHASPASYKALILSYLTFDQAALRIDALRSLMRVDCVWDTAGMIELTDRVTRWKSYQELDLFLIYAKQSRLISPAVVTRLIKLLKSDELLIARRVYWELRDIDLPVPQRDALRAFEQQHRDHL